LRASHYLGEWEVKRRIFSATVVSGPLESGTEGFRRDSGSIAHGYLYVQEDMGGPCRVGLQRSGYRSTGSGTREYKPSMHD